MDSDEYDEDSQPNNQNPDEFRPTFKRLSKNQQIYGDFQQAYQPEVIHQDIFSKKVNAYQQFKPGSVIEAYSSEVEVDLPISKPKPRKIIQEDQDDDKPMLGKFSLNSFLNSLSGNDELRQIIEEDNQDSSQNLPEGLNQKIIAHLQLVKFGQETEQEQVQKLEDMSYESFKKMSRPKVAKIQPKYKTQEEKDLAKEFEAGYGIGFKIMQKIGFKVTKGLGKQEHGIQRPVQAINKTAFTMKDDNRKKQQKNQQQNSVEDQQQTRQLSIPQKIFQYRSKDKKVNNLLIDLKNTFEKLSSQIYHCQSQIQSFKKQSELNDSIKCQNENEIKELNKQIQKLQDLENNLYNCQLYPHLGLHYKLDLLYVRETYDKFKNYDFKMICQSGQKLLRQLVDTLTKFYLAKSKQTLRQYNQSTGMDSKIHMHFPKKKKEEEIIDLDNIGGEDKIYTIGFDDQQKINKYVQFIINKSILPKITNIIDKVSSIQKIDDLRILDILQVVKKFDKKGKYFQEYITNKIVPKCHKYLENFSLSFENSSHNKKYPHLIIFPWLTIVKPEDLNILGFYRKIANHIWSFEDNELYNIINPWIKISSQKEIAFLQNFYIVPRLLYELEEFNISKPNMNLMDNLSKYFGLLKFKQRQQILQNSLFLQVLEAYKKYKQKMAQKDLSKWLLQWKKFTNKISPDVFSKFLKDNSINME